MFLDESGTHENSPCLILAGFAVHEHDAYHLQRALTAVLGKGLKPLGLDSKNYELHANEVRNPDARKHKYSPWRGVDPAIRLRILGDAYRVLSNFHPYNERLPLAAFGVVVDKTQISESIQREELACDERLIKNLWPVFDRVGNEMHGIIHLTPQFARGECGCPPCVNRFANGASRKFGSKRFAAKLVTSEDVEQLKEYFSSR